MTSADERIGANLAKLRGDMSQTALAAEMRSRGFKWSQPTVVAIERGERAIKLAEAEVLVDVLGMNRIEELTTRPLEAIWWARMGTLSRAHDRLVGSTAGFLNARLALAQAADDLVAAGEKVPEGAEESEFWIALSVDETVRRAIPTPPLLPSENDGHFMRTLHASDFADYATRARERWGRGDELTGYLLDKERSDGTAADSAE
ncbi:helix-turn-helix domain-containing protein [Microbacterium sp.]|uniref:helix-turn-helix domain-containing protein n=1 Tax=Microbacterium sp. TaxID=51671 RepID=UPI002810B45E|nr:helix-turn-helix transcriptional regulator [Microbacterium sp.]